MHKKHWFYRTSHKNTWLPSLLRLLLLFFESLKHEVLGSLQLFFLWLKRDKTSERPPFTLSLKRIGVLYVLSIVLPSLLLWNHLGFWLDDLFFPDWRRVKVVKPFFLIGNARSGTTWLHRLLVTSEPDTFTSFRTWEILFGVSVTWKLLFHFLAAIDSRLFRGLAHYLLLALERRLFGHITVHEISLFAAEEDEWLMSHIGHSQLLLFLFPAATSLLTPLIHFDHHDNATDRREMLSLTWRFSLFEYYKECVQRHLYCAHLLRLLRHPKQRLLQLRSLRRRAAEQPPSLVFVSKNPCFTLRLHSLSGAFPDCRVLCLVRQPESSVPSMISYIAKVWSAFSSPTSKYPNARQLLSFCEIHYLFPLLVRPLLFSGQGHAHAQLHFLSYERYKRNVVKELLPLLQSLLEGSEGVSVDWRTVQQRLTHETFRSAAFSSDHRYSLEECCGGLTIYELKERLALVYEAHATILT